MSFYDDIINIVDLLDEIVVDDSKTSQNIFKMLLISRSIMYAHYFSDEKSKQYGADEIGDIVHKIDVSVDLKKVYNKDGYTVKSAAARERVVSSITDCIMSMYSAASALSEQMQENMAGEVSLVLIMLHMLLYKMDQAAFESSFYFAKMSPEKSKKESACIADVLDMYHRLHRCEKIVERESVKLKEKGLVVSSKILSKASVEMKKVDSIAKIKSIADSADIALKNSGEKYKGYSIIKMLRNVISFFARKLFVKRLKSSCKFFPAPRLKNQKKYSRIVARRLMPKN